MVEVLVIHWSCSQHYWRHNLHKYQHLENQRGPIMVGELHVNLTNDIHSCGVAPTVSSTISDSAGVISCITHPQEVLRDVVGG